MNILLNMNSNPRYPHVMVRYINTRLDRVVILLINLAVSLCTSGELIISDCFNIIVLLVVLFYNVIYPFKIFIKTPGLNKEV